MALMCRFSVTAALTAVFLCSETVPGSASTASHFRGGQGEARQTATSQAVTSSIQAALDDVNHGKQGALARVVKIEASMWPTFLALPKNPMGRLAPRAVRHLVHSYFAKEHGWLIKGLSHHGMQLDMTQVHEASVLRAKAPALAEGLLEAQRSGHGLSLSDVVAMAATLESLILDESVALLRAAYSLNGFAAAEEVDAGALHEVLTSYLLVYEMGSKCNLSNVEKHQSLKRSAASETNSWQSLVEFEQDTVLNFEFARRDQTNPFVSAQFSFEAASQIMQGLAQEYGRWQDTECRHMKGALMALDPKATGRVPMSAFYSQPTTADYQFTESMAYLREIGALDEVAGSIPMVRIANYMAGPSNCIASSSYYSVCCLSECDGLMNELEGAIQAPLAPPATLLGLVGNLSSHSIDAPRQLSEPLQARLRSIADRHGGTVPLHGRLFAQWMHFAFPSECPYPHIAEDAAVLTPGHWRGRQATAPEEERQRHIESGGQAVVPADVMEPIWSDEEVLPLQEPAAPARGLGRAAGRLAVQLATLLALARAALSAWRAAAGAVSGRAGSDQKGGLVLPLHL